MATGSRAAVEATLTQLPADGVPVSDEIVRDALHAAVTGARLNPGLARLAGMRDDREFEVTLDAYWRELSTRAATLTAKRPLGAAGAGPATTKLGAGPFAAATARPPFPALMAFDARVRRAPHQPLHGALKADVAPLTAQRAAANPVRNPDAAAPAVDASAATGSHVSPHDGCAGASVFDTPPEFTGLSKGSPWGS